MTRVRFAPSPTGNLHIGGARTALFNWLYARHTGGKFLLRIEDTDLARSTEESLQAIMEALEWLGLDHDEPPVRQTERRDEHVRLANELLDKGLAYRCYCTAEELEKMREDARARGDQPRYDRRWRDNDEAPSADAPFSVRFKMPIDGELTINDQVLGDVTVGNKELDDLVILRSDGTPTYNFVVVCDDAHMGITHVIRGQDHLRNSFRQTYIYRALGFDPPTFAHLPLVDGLSKRKGSSGVQDYRDRGFLKEALINYIARLGWSHGDQELFTIEELIKHFDVVNVQRGSSSYDEKKMLWVNAEWIKRLPAEELAARLLPFLQNNDIEASVDERMCFLVDQLRPRANTLVDMASAARFAYVAPTEYNEKAVTKWLKAESKPAIEALIEQLEAIETWDVKTISDVVGGIVKSQGVKFMQVGQPIRVALAGDTQSPSIGETIWVVGQAESVGRLRKILPMFSAQ